VLGEEFRPDGEEDGRPDEEQEADHSGTVATKESGTRHQPHGPVLGMPYDVKAPMETVPWNPDEERYSKLMRVGEE
jgi:hypothetical protein